MRGHHRGKRGGKRRSTCLLFIELTGKRPNRSLNPMRMPGATWYVPEGEVSADELETAWIL